MLGPNFNVTPGPALQPSYGSEILNYLVNVTAAATRLGTLLVTAGSVFTNGIPLIVDEMSTGPGMNTPRLRPPWHLRLQVPSTAINSVYMTWDNRTTPVALGPGIELVPGKEQWFYNAGTTILRAKTIGLYQVPATSAIQLIASGATPLLVTFSD